MDHFWSSLWFYVVLGVQALRRLAQNREAARKSRLRKKVIIIIIIISSNSHVAPQHGEICCFQKLNSQQKINKSCVFFGSLGWFISWIKIMGIDKHGELFFLGELGICTTTWIKPNQVESTWAGASKSSAASEFLSIFHNSLLCGGGVVVPYLFPWVPSFQGIFQLYESEKRKATPGGFVASGSLHGWGWVWYWSESSFWWWRKWRECHHIESRYIWVIHFLWSVVWDSCVLGSCVIECTFPLYAWRQSRCAL